jgi:cbb3-type cytochrome oxidase maturation protein
MLGYLASSILMALAGILIYIYYLRKGQFEDPEDVKYQMFRQEEIDKNEK